MHLFLYAAFVLSGVAGLIYESIWSRYLGLFVGHGAYAQVIVLAIFLGGMAVGALLVGRRSERIPDPLVWYAGAELLVALYGLFFHELYRFVTDFAYDTLFAAVPGGPVLAIVRWTIAGSLILPPSVVLGTTFPLMSAGVLRRAPERPGHTLAMLYFANSLGGAIGVVVAGFYLLAVAGLPGTVVAASMLNLSAAAIAFLVARARPVRVDTGIDAASAEPSPEAVAASPPEGTTAERLWRILLVVSFGTAVASFVYEIAWIRMLSLALGSATHAFDLMLSAFILGMALGALWLHRRADSFRDGVRALGFLQWAMGLAAIATLPVYVASFDWIVDLFATLRRSAEGYRAFNLSRYGVAMAVMVPAAFFAGTTLPLITRILITAGKGERSIGWVYGLNTLGSIVGVALAGLVLMPLLGLKNLLLAGAALDMALGVWLLALVPSRRRLLRPAVVTACITVAVVAWNGLALELDPIRLTAGVFRHGQLPPQDGREVVFYRDGRTATVSAVRAPAGEDSILVLATNGKPDASLRSWWLREGREDEPRRAIVGDESTQTFLPLVTLAHAPNARTAAVIGHGSGISSHFLLASSRLERVTTIDIEREMVEGSWVFYPANRRVFEDTRSVIVIDDAKSFFAAERRRYDLILSEPSNPWVSGVSGLFTEEFYRRIRDYLTENGVLGQWLHIYEISDGLILSVLAALHRQFPSYALYQVSAVDLLIVASARPELPRPDWSVITQGEIAEELHRLKPFTGEQLDATWLADRRVLAPLLDDWPQPNSDFFPILDLRAEEARYRDQLGVGFIGLGGDRFDLAAAIAGRRRDFSENADAPVPSIPRLRARATGAALREARRRREGAPAELDAAAKAALHRWHRFQSVLAGDQPPADWRLWLVDALVVERDLHGGTAGVADETFYDGIRRYARRHGAPAAVHAAIAFQHGLAAWDFAEAADAAQALIDEAQRGTFWLEPELLRDGATFARLATGDVEGARQAWESLGRFDRRTRDDLRVRLLEALLHPRENDQREIKQALRTGG